MDLDVLDYDLELIPPGIDPSLWVRWLKGTRAFDAEWGKGARCPSAKKGAACCCKRPPVDPICKIWRRLAEIARGIGPHALDVMEKMER